MTDIFSKPNKLAIRKRLFHVALTALERDGWTVDRIPRAGKSSLRAISRDKERKKVTIRTSQDTWIAFPRSADDSEWETLNDVDFVVAASVDDAENPRFANVHMIPGDEMRARFDRAYAARKKAGHTIPLERGIWVSLYHQETNNPVNRVGAGAGLLYPPMVREALNVEGQREINPQKPETFERPAKEEAPLSIAEAKRRLARTLGVSESEIKITING